jgi:hypothetical protein
MMPFIVPIVPQVKFAMAVLLRPHCAQQVNM